MGLVKKVFTKLGQIRDYYWFWLRKKWFRFVHAISGGKNKVVNSSSEFEKKVSDSIKEDGYFVCEIEAFGDEAQKLFAYFQGNRCSKPPAAFVPLFV